MRLSLRKEMLTELTTTEIESIQAANASGLPCEITRTLCFPTCGPMCTGTSTTRLGAHLES